MSVLSSSGVHRAHSAKVALIAASVVLTGYVVTALLVDTLVLHRLVSQVDERLSQRLVAASRPPSVARGEPPASRTDPDDAPVFAWRVSPAGLATPLSPGAPVLARRTWSSGTSTSFDVQGTPFRFRAVSSSTGWIVAGESIRQMDRIRTDLLVAELLLGAVVFALGYLGALMIGLRASAPVEEVRRRQAEFTADASHELRTPLSVIEAEVQLALGGERGRDYYRATLERVSGESRRLRSIVDDLLWLARADAGMPADPRGPTDLRAAVQESATRFRAVAASAGVTLQLELPEDPGPYIDAPPDWIDRLVGVLVDNACRFAGDGGEVRVWTGVHGDRVGLIVDDTGPGIPPEERDRIFERFHRCVDSTGGTGLGLAIADAVVEATRGTWSVGRSPIGGARMEVAWHEAHSRAGGSQVGGSPASGPAAGRSRADRSPAGGKASRRRAVTPDPSPIDSGR